MKIHREGNATLSLVAIVLIILNLALLYFIGGVFVIIPSLLISFGIFFFFLYFFRYPKRISDSGPFEILSPADGEVVVIEQTEEIEYFKDKRIQVSVFMSPLNVHVNWYPVSGTVKYVKYHPGKFLVAWHPKSSTLNERSTTVIQTESGTEILVRQIAGAVARRVVTYAKEGNKVEKNLQLGFIKFGSRLDILLPLNSEIVVKLKDKVKGNQTVIARIQ
jgi:phosphatidylserine decarboxylase